jgi:SagB-type dehydrogenase family enzyme
VRRRDLDYIVIAAMLVTGLYVTLTGVIADLFGLHQFAYHASAGYLCAGFVLLHIILNGRRIVGYLRQLPRRRPKHDRRSTEPTGEGASVGRRQVLLAALSAAGGFLVGWLVPDRREGLPGEARDIGDLYHEWSSPNHSLDLPVPDWGGRPPRYKSYPEAVRVSLPEPGGFQDLTVREALEARRSVRDYGAAAMSTTALSGLLHGAQGITNERRAFRAAPSAGALYPIELYPVVHRVDGVVSGIYHYAVRQHQLERLERGDFRSQVTRAGLYQGFLGEAGVCFLISAVFQRMRWKYRERAYRYVLLEAGHVAENLYLAATAMGLGACAVGAFYDDQFNRLLGLDGEQEAVIYVVSIGTRA